MQDLLSVGLAAFMLTAPLIDGPQEPAPEPERVDHGFELPCDGYRKALRGKGNFGLYIDPRRSKSVFAGSYHLAEDVWLPGGTEVRSVADGRVVYSDFSPSWIDDTGFVHRNFGNVIVIEHELPPEGGEPQWICSVYVHLGADREVEVDDEVTRGAVIGTIGKDKSEENGLYPAHLHFGLHPGPYVQISPAWGREVQRDALEFGLPCDPGGELVRGEIKITLEPDATARIDFVGTDKRMWLSLLVGSTSPDYKPADIMGWCQGYGDKKTVKDWVRPSSWIRKHRPRK